MSCIVCGGLDKKPVYTLTEKGGAQIVRCGDCALVQLDSIPAAEELARLYADGYFEGVGTDVGYAEYARQEREYLATFGADIERIVGLTQGRRLLDVGCGYGYFVRRAQAEGFDSHGVDLSQEAILEAARHVPGRVHCGMLGEIEELAGQRFDVVFASHLIEHIATPREFVVDLAARIEKGGLLVLVTPNIESWLARISGARWVSFKIPEHVAYYSPKTLGALVESAGLELVAIDSAYQYYQLPFLMSKIRDLIRPIDKLIPAFENGRLFRDRMLRVTSGSLRLIARRP